MADKRKGVGVASGLKIRRISMSLPGLEYMEETALVLEYLHPQFFEGLTKILKKVKISFKKILVCTKQL